MTTLTLPWPPASLSGHAKGGWKARAAATKRQRSDAYLLTRNAMPAIPASGDIRLRIEFVPPDRRGDRTNFAHRIKGALDGIAQALGVNDARFLPTYEFCEPAKPGCVRVTLEAA